MLHIFTIILNFVVVVFFGITMTYGIIEQFDNTPVKMKFFYNLSFWEFLTMVTFLFLLPLLNIRFIYHSK